MQRTIQLAKRTHLPKDPIDAIFQEIPHLNEERKKKGLKPIISLCIGEPHLAINAASIKRLAEYLTLPEARLSFGYSPLEGRTTTRDAVTKLYQQYYPKAYYTAEELMICNGATQGLTNAFSLLLDEGDQVLAFEPFYSTYQIQAKQQGGNLIKLSTAENNFRPSADLLDSALKKYPRAKILILNYPNNPTGIDLTKKELQEIVEVLQKYPHIAIVWDDVYRELTQTEHITILDIDPSLKDRCIMINSASKGLIGAPDMRIGMVGANKDWINHMVSLQANAVGSINWFSQIALVASINSELTANHNYLSWLDKSKKAYACNMQFVSDYLKSISFKIINGGNGFFILAQAAFLIGHEIPTLYLQEKIGHKTFESDMDIAFYLLHAAGVAAVPGSGFGIDETKGYIRISCAKDEKDLKEALSNIKNAIEVIPSINLMNNCYSRPRKRASRVRAKFYQPNSSSEAKEESKDSVELHVGKALG